MQNIAVDNFSRENSLLTISDLAKMLRISEKSVYSLNYRGVGPAYLRIGKSVRYRRETVSKWLQDKESAAWHR